MRVAVIGAGLAGVATAQALAARGHRVAVFERRSSVAEETSFAPGGIAAAALVAPWRPATAGWRAALSPREHLPDIEIGAAFAAPRLFRAADPTLAATRANRARVLHRLLTRGIEGIHAVAHALRLEFECTKGLLLTLPDSACSAQSDRAVEWLREVGEHVDWVDVARQRVIEPGLVIGDDARRAAWLPEALIGNTREWTQLLRQHAQAQGVRFLFQHEVISITPGSRPSLRLAREHRADDVPAKSAFDAIIVCAALESSHLLAPLGLKLPWQPLRGWSVTAPLQLREAAPLAAPRGALLDVRSGISIARLGTRVRVSGGQAPGAGPGPNGAAPPGKQLQPLYDALEGSFPGTAQWPQALVWQGTRALLPDGLPAIGPSGLPGVWLSVGHGHHGWPLSQLGAEALCAMIEGKPVHADIGLLSPQRLSAAGTAPESALEHTRPVSPST